MENLVGKVSENPVRKVKSSVDVESLLKEKLETTLGTKSIEDLQKEEEVLKKYLDKLKKDNYLFKAGINAWYDTLKKKLKEFKQTELNLNDAYQDIWSEREIFCSKAKEFNDEFGVLSNWWKAQLDFVCDLENFRKKKIEEKDRQKEVKVIQKELEDLEKEIEGLEEQQNLTKVEVHTLGDGNSRTEEISPSAANNPEKDTDKKKVTFADNLLTDCPSDLSPEDFLFSMMNVNRARNAKKKLKSRSEKRKKSLRSNRSSLPL